SGPAAPSDDLLAPGPDRNGHGRSRHDAPGFDRDVSEPDHGAPRGEDVARSGRDGRRSGRRDGPGFDRAAFDRAAFDRAAFDRDEIGRDAAARPEATGRLAA